MLKSVMPINVDPPVLYMKDDVKYSGKLRAYLNNQSLIHYSYSTDSNGFRKTIPSVNSENQILVIGDSVAFGVGVDDQYTVSSQLQNLIGQEYKVINGAVGGYNGRQAFLVAKNLSNERKFSGLIYIACQNDFMEHDDWVEEAKVVLQNIRTISDRFHNNIIIVLETYMEYNLQDFFLEKGWSREDIEKTNLLRDQLPKVAEELGFRYRDWSVNVNNFMKKEKSIFSRFSLYVDHAHLSPLGNQVMAEELFSIIQSKWVRNEERQNKFPG